jgi:hypothetical protein
MATNLKRQAEKFENRVINDYRIAGTVNVIRDGRHVTCESAHAERLDLARKHAEDLMVAGSSLEYNPGRFTVHF